MAAGGPSEYDAFISYSHAADDLLAPRLQAGMQRFAKPWWRRRAIRVFRDESSLSASPHLWESITKALDGSAWFVLLLSPDAADSHWVGQEIAHWISDPQRADRVLPVVTEGEFEWRDGDVVGSAVPDALRGVFESEPRWVDLRFARGETQLDLKNPRFSAAVADVASAVRGVPKDELESEEVRQHRRTIRTAWAAVLLVLLLGVAASVAAVFALNEQARANAEADRANASASEAEAQRAEAESNRAQAVTAAGAEAEARVAAEEAAELAQARELVLEAERSLASDPEVSLHLALFALDVFRSQGEDPAQAVGVIRAAIPSQRVVARFPGTKGVDAHPNEPLITTISPADDRVLVIDVRTGEVVETYLPSAIDVRDVVFHPDGDSLVLLQVPPAQTAAADVGVVIWDRMSGSPHLVEFGNGSSDLRGRSDLVISPGGDYLVSYRDESGTIAVWSVTRGESVLETFSEGPGLGGHSGQVNVVDITSSPDAGGLDVLAFAVGSEVFALDLSSAGSIFDIATSSAVRRFQVSETGAISMVAWSPDGQLLALQNETSLTVVDAVTGSVNHRHELAGFTAFEWLRDSGGYIVGDRSGLRVVELDGAGPNLDLLGSLAPGPDGFTVASLSDLGLAAVTSDNESDVLLFDLSEPGPPEVATWTTSFTTSGPARFLADQASILVSDGNASYAVIDSIDGSTLLASQAGGVLPAEHAMLMSGDGRFVAFGDSSGRWAVRRSDTGELVYAAPVDHLIQGLSWDGTLAVIGASRDCDAAKLVWLADGSVLGDVSPECAVQGGTSETGARQFDGRRFHFSPDGRFVVVGDDLLTLEGTAGSTWPSCWCIQSPLFGDDLSQAIAFTPDSSRLLAGTSAGVLSVFDANGLQSQEGLSGALVVSIQAHNVPIAHIAVSPDGKMATTSAAGDPLRIWDLDTGLLLAEFGGSTRAGTHFGLFHPSLPHLVVVSPPNQVRIHTLDIDELVDIAWSRITRSLTQDECERYFHGDCPARTEVGPVSD